MSGHGVVRGAASVLLAGGLACRSGGTGSAGTGGPVDATGFAPPTSTSGTGTSTSASSATATTGTAGATATSSSFIDPTTGGPWICELPGCETGTAGGCPAGTKCVQCNCNPNEYEFYGHEGCAMSGTIPMGELCPSSFPVCGTGIVDPCEPGSACFRDVCYPLCHVGPDGGTCDDPKARCLFPTEPWNRGYACTIPCDPLADDCASGTRCALTLVLGMTDMVFSCWKATVGTGVYGSPCQRLEDCAKGFVCRDGDDLPPGVCDGYCCTPYCDVTDPLGDAQCPDADEGMKCSYFIEDIFAPDGVVPIEESEHVGLCYVPP